MDTMLSCLILSYNEEHRIKFVIEAAKRWADEVVVVDKSSTDETPNIARNLGARVYQLPYSEQGTEDGRDVVAASSYDWVICLTAGEIPTPNLIVNVRRLIRSRHDTIDLILVPLKYWSFGLHDKNSPWGWSKQPRVFNKNRITYINQVHNHLTAIPERTIDLSHLRESAHVLHQTHPNSKQFIRSHWEYMRAEADADPNVRLANALSQISKYDSFFNQCSNKLQMHAWKLYWHGVALHCLERIQERNIEAEYSWRREKYYQLWDSGHLEAEDEPKLLQTVRKSFKYSCEDDCTVRRDSNFSWITNPTAASGLSLNDSLVAGDFKGVQEAALRAIFYDPSSPELCKSIFYWQLNKGCYSESILWVENIAKFEPQNLNWINSLIISCARIGQFKKAIDIGELATRRFGPLAVIEKNLDVVKRRYDNSSQKIYCHSPVVCRSKPKVSAIVSVYNASKYLEGCLNNLFAQSLFAAGLLQVVVVNTGSQQDEGEIVRAFIARGYEIKYIEVPDRETVYSAWNRGIQVSDADFVTSANADDRHHAKALEILAGELDKNSDAALVYADVDITEEENRGFGEALILGQYRWAEFCPIQLLKGCYCGPQPMWRKEIHGRIGYFDSDFVSAGDYEMWLRMAVDHKFIHVQQLLGLYLKSPQSIEHSNGSRGVNESEIARGRYRDIILKKHSK